MTLFAIDQEKCTKCSACVEECPTKIVAIKPGEFPFPIASITELCINCGHCVAVCPYGALSLKRMSVDRCPPIRREWVLGPEEAEQFLRSRRSIRTYKKEPVEKAVIEKLVEVARYAPTGHNSQPLRWKVFYHGAELKRLGELTIDWMKYMIEKRPEEAKLRHFDLVVAQWNRQVDLVFRSAPHLVVCHAQQANPFAATAAVIALSYMELAAPSLSLGACWAGYFQMASTGWSPLAEALELPPGHLSLGSLIIGYPKYKYHRLPQRNKPVISWK